MSEESTINLEDIEEKLQNLGQLSNESIEIPGLGKILLSDLPRYIPLYLKFTENKSIRAIIPDEIHDAIVSYAELSGLIEPPEKKLKIADINIPKTYFVESLLAMEKAGWGQAQIAKQLNMTNGTVKNLIREAKEERNSRKFSYKIKTIIESWLRRRVEQKLEDVIQLEPIQHLLEKEAQKENSQLK